MLKQSLNVLGMLMAKYRAVLKKMRLKNLAFLPAAVILFCAAPVSASNYDVGTGQPYTTLAALMADTNITFKNDDTITIHNTLNDSSLPATLDFKNAKVIITPMAGTDIRFLELQLATAINASNVKISNFSVTSSGSDEAYGGAIYGKDKVTLSTSGGITFEGNSASSEDVRTFSGKTYGGAIYGAGDIDINNSGGNIVFNGNSVSSKDVATNIDVYSGKAYGGAIYGVGDINIDNGNSNITFNGNKAYTFTSNYSDSTQSIQAYSSFASGGAIYSENGDITVRNSANISFEGNEALAQSTTDGSNEENNPNASLAFGGAIYGGNGAITISANDKIYFKDNKASLIAESENAKAWTDSAYGGAIYGGSVFVSDSNDIIFEDNKASADASGSYTSTSSAVGGGAIYSLTDISISANSSANSNISFKNNKASAVAESGNDFASVGSAYGGAIFGGASGSGNFLTISDSSSITFEGNEAFAKASGGASAMAGNNLVGGGAIYSLTNIFINASDNIDFKENKTSVIAESEHGEARAGLAFGGAIYGARDIDVSGGVINFENNEAYSFSSAGAVSAGSVGTDGAYGGAISGAGNILIRDSDSVIFKENKAKAEAFITDGYIILGSVRGGAIHSRGNVSINGVNSITFEGNEVFSSSVSSSSASVDNFVVSGGAIYSDDKVTVNTDGEINFNSNKVSTEASSKNNSAHTNGASGGAIFGAGGVDIESNGGNITFDDNNVSSIASVDSDNFAYFRAESGGVYGGAIYSDNKVKINASGTINFNDNTVSTEAYSKNVSANTNGASGGAIYGGSVFVSASDSITFEGNQASSEAFIKDFSNSTATSGSVGGGAIYSLTDTSINSSSSIYFKNNTASIIAESENGTASINSIYGGAIYGGASYEDNIFTISASDSIIFEGNGAFIKALGNASPASIGNLIHGGAIYGDADISISAGNKIYFKNNEASVVAESETGTASIGLVRGGAIYSERDVDISGSEIAFENNEASSLVSSVSGSASSNGNYGGAIYANNDVTIENSNSAIFIDNKAKAEAESFNNVGYATANSVFGGAIYSNGSIYISDINSITFENNEAYAFSSSTGSTSSNGGFGGAIYANNDVTIKNSDSAIFQSNKAKAVAKSVNQATASQNFGGAIYSSRGSISISNIDKIIFDSNEASALSYSTTDSAYSGEVYGGAIYGQDSVIDISGGSKVFFQNNIASSKASSDTYSSNSGKAYGGAIFGEGNIEIKADINNGEINFDNNSALSTSDGSYDGDADNAFGGAIYSNGGDVNITGNKIQFIENTAASIASLSFGSADSEQVFGGAIYASNNNINIIGDSINFSGNKAVTKAFNNDFITNLSFLDQAHADRASGGAMYTASVNIQADGSVNFNDNEASSETSAHNINVYGGIAQGGAILGYNNVDINSADTITFSGNKAFATASVLSSSEDNIYTNTLFAVGGAISSDYDINLYGNAGVSFENNEASAKASAEAPVSGSLSSTSYTDSGTASGGAISGTNVTIGSNGLIDFSGNKVSTVASAESGSVFADSANGGAINAGNIDISGDSIVFSQNTAFSSVVSSNGYAVSRGAYGGAIYAVNKINITGNDITFTGNSATATGMNAYGGAIYASGDVTIGSGNVTFKNNTANGINNAIYIDNLYNNNLNLTLTADNGKTISFYDPVENNSSRINVHINGGPNAGGQLYTGKVLFDTYQSKVYGNTTVYGGTMQLTNGAIYGADSLAGSYSGSFELGTGATLLTDANVSGNANSIKADSITFDSGSKLNFDMNKAKDKNGANATTNLYLEGANFSGQTIGSGTVDILYSGTMNNGTYTLVDVSGINSNTQLADNGELLYNGQGTFTDRRATAFYLENDNNKLLNLVVSDLLNTTVTWTNNDSQKPGYWDSLISKNWTGVVKSKNVSQFLNDDSVIFGDAGAGSVVVDAKGVTITDNANGQLITNPPIAGMTVNNSSGNDYTFSGGSIGDSSNSGGASGRLIKDGAGELTLNNANTYTGGTQLNGGKINIGNDQALGTNSLSMGTGTTLGFNGNYKIANNININDSSSANFKTNGGVNAAITGEIQGDIASDFNKTGAGTLTIGKANVTNATVEEGRLRIDYNKTLTVADTLELKDGTILGVGLNKAVTADKVIIGEDVTLNLNYLDNNNYASGTEITLIQAKDVVVDHFTRVTIGGVEMIDNVDLKTLVSPDEYFLKITVQRFGFDNHNVKAIINGLAWKDTVPDTSHGTFNIADNFTLGVKLIDNDTVTDLGTNNALGWDGKTLTKTGAGTLTLTGDNEYSGNTEIKKGTLVLTSANSIGGSSGVILGTDGTNGTDATAGTLKFNYTDNNFGKSIALNGVGGAIDTNANNITLTGEISGNGGLTKEGAGELTLTGTNTYSGDTQINQGTLALTDEDSIKNSNSLSIGTNATTGTLKFNSGYSDSDFDKDITLNEAGGAINATTNNITLEGVISGAGNLTTDGDISITNNNIGFSGNTLINSGALTLTDGNALGTGQVQNNTALSLDFVAGNFTNRLSGAGSLTTDGDISITNNNSSFSGNTRINSGTLTLKQENALGTGAVQNNTALSLDFAAGNFTNQLSGTGRLTTAGNISISNNNIGFSGKTFINSGTLALEQENALGTGAVQNNDTLSLNFGGRFNNQLSGAGTLNIGGDISIDNDNTGFAGTTNILKNSTTTLGNIYGLGDNKIVNYGTLNFSYDTPAQKDINIKSYSGDGVIGLQASLTSAAAADKWVDKLSFESNPLNQVNVRFNFTNGSDLKYLSSDDTSMVFAELLSGGNTNADLFKLDNAYGLIGAKNLLIKNTNNKQTFYLGTEFNSSASKVYHEVAAASLSQAAVMHNRQLFDGFAQAIQHSKKNSPGIYVEGEKFNLSHGTGNNADIKGNSSAIAMAWEKDEKTAYGIFGQQFNGSYENSHEITIGNDSQTVYSNGDLRYHVLGLFAHHRPEGQKAGDPGHYYEAVLKAGRAINDFRANNFQQRTSNFQIDQNIFGFSLGGGYVKNSGKDNTTEYYGHLIYTKLGGNDTTDSIGQHININSADSVRMLTGARLNFNQNKKTTAYFGAALDYEFSGKAGVYIDGFEAESAKLKGLTGIMELGFKSNHGKDNSLSLEGALHGYVGKKKGLGGILTLSKSF